MDERSETMTATSNHSDVIKPEDFIHPSTNSEDPTLQENRPGNQTIASDDNRSGDQTIASDDNRSGEQTVPTDATMSKRARKRLEASLRKKVFLKGRRQEERAKKKKKLKEKKAAGIEVGPSRKALKLNTMALSKCKVSVAVDCSFDELMTEKDIKSIVKQVNFCYASNRRALEPMQFHMTSFTKRLRQIMDDIGQHSHWDVNLHDASYDEVFPVKDLVYLSSDSPNVLHKLDDTKVYIIGGLVDHNHHKGVCLRLAEEKGIAHAQLPIGDYFNLESRKVLAVNHVFDILLRFTEDPDWQEAFHKVIPQRKNLTLKDSVVEQTDKSAAAEKLGKDLDCDNINLGESCSNGDKRWNKNNIVISNINEPSDPICEVDCSEKPATDCMDQT